MGTTSLEEAPCLRPRCRGQAASDLGRETGRNMGRDRMDEDEIALPLSVGRSRMRGNGGALQLVEKKLLCCSARISKGLG